MSQTNQPKFESLNTFISSIYVDKDFSNSIYLIIEFPTQQIFKKINVQVHDISHQGHSSLQCGYYNIDHHQCKNINLAKKNKIVDWVLKFSKISFLFPLSTSLIPSPTPTTTMHKEKILVKPIPKTSFFHKSMPLLSQPP